MIACIVCSSWRNQKIKCHRRLWKAPILLRSSFFYKYISSAQPLPVSFSVIYSSHLSCFTLPWSDSHFAASVRRWAPDGQWLCLRPESPDRPARYMGKVAFRPCPSDVIAPGQSSKSVLWNLVYSQWRDIVIQFSEAPSICRKINKILWSQWRFCCLLFLHSLFPEFLLPFFLHIGISWYYILDI